MAVRIHVIDYNFSMSIKPIIMLYRHEEHNFYCLFIKYIQPIIWKHIIWGFYCVYVTHNSRGIYNRCRKNENPVIVLLSEVDFECGVCIQYNPLCAISDKYKIYAKFLELTCPAWQSKYFFSFLIYIYIFSEILSNLFPDNIPHIHTNILFENDGRLV